MGLFRSRSTDQGTTTPCPSRKTAWYRGGLGVERLEARLALAGIPLVSPIEGVPFRDWTITGYMDLDSRAGAFQDYRGGAYTYDGHNGIDFALANFAVMDAGVSVYAAAGGLVTGVQDGEFDRCRSWTDCDESAANHVWIDHLNGWHTLYTHLRRGSVRVAVGQPVAAGQEIGLVGSSGRSSGPHLHFGAYYLGDPVATFVNPTDFWASPWAYAGDQPGSLDFGVTDVRPSNPNLDRPVDKTAFEPGVDSRVVFWANIHGIPAGDATVRIRWQSPNGSDYLVEGLPPLSEPVRFWWLWSDLDISPTMARGTWRVILEHRGAQLATTTFRVGNAAPTISDVTNRSIEEDATPGPIEFTVGDQETAIDSLVVSATSSDATLVPNENILLGGAGANRTVTLTPAANRSGTTTITLVVSDGTLTTQDTFVVTVTAANDPPTISAIEDQSTIENSPALAIPFSMDDVDTPLSSITVAIDSSNAVLFPPASLMLSGAGANRTLTLTPAANQVGVATITIRVGDGAATVEESFLLTVTGYRADIDVRGPGGVSIVSGDTTASLADGTHFGSQTVGALDVTHTFTLANVGQLALQLGGEPAVSLSGDAANDFWFRWLSAATTVIDPNAQALFEIGFRPSEPESRAATVSISSNDLDESPFTFVIQGTGSAGVPQIDVRGNVGQSIVNGDLTPSAAEGTQFGTYPLGTTAIPRMFSIVNVGGAAVRLTGEPPIAVTGAAAGDFTIQWGDMQPTLIEPTHALAFEIVFRPTGPGLRMATVSIANNDADDNPFTFAISGRGLAPPTISDIDDQTTYENSATAAIAFTIDDADTPISSLSVSASSSDTALVPAENIILEGTGPNRTVTVTPAAEQSGSTIITITVSDGALSGQTAFTLTVHDSTTPCPFSADWDDDAMVTLADFRVLAESFGGTGSSSEPGDINCDGRIGVRDLVLLRNQLAPRPAVPIAASVHSWVERSRAVDDVLNELERMSPTIPALSEERSRGTADERRPYWSQDQAVTLRATRGQLRPFVSRRLSRVDGLDP